MNRTENLKTASDRLKEAQQLILLAIEKESISLIDRDLILEKLRKVYDLILFEEIVEKQIISIPSPNQPAKATVEKVREIPSKPSTPEVKPQGNVEPIQTHQKEQESAKPKTFKRTSIFDTTTKLKPVNAEERESVDEKTEEPSAQKEQSILGTPHTESLAEKFQGKRKFMTDSLSKQIRTKPVAAKLQGKPIADLTKEIGVHDKFVFIKELFNDNSKLYEDTVARVNQFDDITEALIYIQENFSWNDKNKAANKFIELIRRKLLND